MSEEVLWMAYAIWHPPRCYGLALLCRTVLWERPVYINTSPASSASPVSSAPDKCMYRHFSGAGKVYLNTSPVPERCFQILPRLLRRRRSVFKYLSGAGEVFIYIYLSDTSPAPEKLGKYLKTPFQRRRSIYTQFSGAGEVLIYTYLAPERPEKPEKYLYAPL